MSNFDNHGERQSDDKFDWGYFAHLSIYDFAGQCGTGYGVKRMLDSGASTVSALERDEDLVRKLSADIKDATFLSCDLENGILPFSNETFDVVFSSNVFEHIIGVDAILDECRRVLKKYGLLILAVPPVDGVGSLYINAQNMFHITNLCSSAWQAKLQRYFSDVTSYRHWTVDDRVVDGHILRDDAKLSDFIFSERRDSESTITAIFVAKNARDVVLGKSSAEENPEDWDSARVEAKARIATFVSIMDTKNQVEDYWRKEIMGMREYLEKQIKINPSKAAKDTLNRLNIYFS